MFTRMSYDCQLSVCLLDFQLGGIWLDPKGIVVYRVGDHGVLVVPVSRVDGLGFCGDGGVGVEEDRRNGKVGSKKIGLGFEMSKASLFCMDEDWARWVGVRLIFFGIRGAKRSAE